MARTMGDVFPEIRAKQKSIKERIRREEDSFNKTLDKGIEEFQAMAHAVGASRMIYWGADDLWESSTLLVSST